MTSFLPGLPDEFWSGKPISYKDGSSAVKAWFDRIAPSTVNPTYFKDTFDFRAKFSRNMIVVREYLYLGLNSADQVPDNELYRTYVYTGNFNYKDGSFVDGVLSNFYVTYREKRYLRGDIYPDGRVASYQVSGLSVDRDRLASIESDPTIKEVLFRQGDDGSRSVRIGQNSNVEPYIRYNSLQELQSGMRSEGIPEVLIDPFYGYLSDPLLKYDFPTISSSGSSPISPSPQSNTIANTVGVDNLTGTSKQKDLFQFTSTPNTSGQPDKITGFSTKEKDTIQISKSVFGVATGRFAIAKNPKTLNKLLATDVDIVYNQKAGQLILNANGVEPGVGADGGVFALLVGNPKLATSSLSFV